MNIRDPKAQLRVNNPDAISDIDALEPIQSQYSASPRLLELLVRKAAILDIGRDAMLFWLRAFNPKTAIGWGLDAWARIVGAARTIMLPRNEFLGLAPSDRLSWRPENVPEDQKGLYGIFFDDQDVEYASDLDDESLRAVIFWKAAGNIGTADAATINRLLRTYFKEWGPVFIIEMGVMAIRVLSFFELDAVHRSIFRKYGVMGRGAGVYVDWLEIPWDYFGCTAQNLGEDGEPLPDSPPPSNWLPFGQAPFFASEAIVYEPD